MKVPHPKYNWWRGPPCMKWTSVLPRMSSLCKVVTAWWPTIFWAFGYGQVIWTPFSTSHRFCRSKIQNCPMASCKKVGPVQLHHHLARCLGFGVPSGWFFNVFMCGRQREIRENEEIAVTYKKRKGPEIHGFTPLTFWEMKPWNSWCLEKGFQGNEFRLQKFRGCNVE